MCTSEKYNDFVTLNAEGKEKIENIDSEIDNYLKQKGLNTELFDDIKEKDITALGIKQPKRTGVKKRIKKTQDKKQTASETLTEHVDTSNLTDHKKDIETTGKSRAKNKSLDYLMCYVKQHTDNHNLNEYDLEDNDERMSAVSLDYEIEEHTKSISL